MKKVFVLTGVALLLTPLLALATTLTVQTNQASLRSEPSFVGKIIATVGYRSQVNLLQEKGAWRFVQYQQKQGWMHISALIAQKVQLTAEKLTEKEVALSGKGISSKELTMAGKGLKELENALKTKNPSLNYGAVDKMEQINVSPAELEKFALEGDFSTAAR